MHPGSHKPDTAGDLARYFNNAQQLSQHETLGQIVAEILRSGSNLNRTAICSRLVRRLELAGSMEEERHYHKLIGFLPGRQNDV